MNENDTVADDTERLEELDQEIKEARHHLEDMTHEDRPEFYENDESKQEEYAPGAETPDEAPPGTAPGELPG